LGVKRTLLLTTTNAALGNLAAPFPRRVVRESLPVLAVVAAVVD